MTQANSGLSIIVSDTNTGARRLYERSGYREAGKRGKVKEDWQHPGHRLGAADQGGSEA